MALLHHQHWSERTGERERERKRERSWRNTLTWRRTEESRERRRRDRDRDLGGTGEERERGRDLGGTGEERGGERGRDDGESEKIKCQVNATARTMLRLRSQDRPVSGDTHPDTRANSDHQY